jgi:hypothetical protein
VKSGAFSPSKNGFNRDKANGVFICFYGFNFGRISLLNSLERHSGLSKSGPKSSDDHFDAEGCAVGDLAERNGHIE